LLDSFSSRYFGALYGLLTSLFPDYHLLALGDCLLWQFFFITEVAQSFWATYFGSKGMYVGIRFDTEWVGLHILGDFFHKIIWSLCLDGVKRFKTKRTKKQII
jgi:hypothetical protein